MFSDGAVLNRGIGGDTSKEMFSRLKNTALLLKPQKVFIWVGTNDLAQGFTPDTICENIRKCFRAFRTEQKNVRIYLFCVTPVSYQKRNPIADFMVGKRKNQTIQALNASYRALCKKENVACVDFYNKLLNGKGELNDDYTWDGLHLTATGYQIAVQVMRSILTKKEY